MGHITGKHSDITTRIQSLTSSISDINTFVIEAKSYVNSGVMTSGLLRQQDYLLRLKKFQITQSGQVLAQPLLY